MEPRDITDGGRAFNLDEPEKPVPARFIVREVRTYTGERGYQVFDKKLKKAVAYSLYLYKAIQECDRQNGIMR